MKIKIDNKGMTLVELIVSFTLVSIAVVYFGKSLYAVQQLYLNARKETTNYVNVNYAYRLIDACIESTREDDEINPNESINCVNNIKDEYLKLEKIVSDNSSDNKLTYKMQYYTFAEDADEDKEVNAAFYDFIFYIKFEPKAKEARVYHLYKYTKSLLEDPTKGYND